MARSCKAAVEAIRQGKWTLDDMQRWIDACIEQDPAYLENLKSSVDTFPHRD